MYCGKRNQNAAHAVVGNFHWLECTLGLVYAGGVGWRLILQHTLHQHSTPGPLAMCYPAKQHAGPAPKFEPLPTHATPVQPLLSRPATPAQVAEAVLQLPRLLPRAGGSKPALSTPPTGVISERGIAYVLLLLACGPATLLAPDSARSFCAPACIR